MRCSSCGKENLPGGVRCIYCGVHYPKLSEFDLNLPEAKKSAESKSPPAASSNRARGWLASLGILALKAKSLFALLKFGSFIKTFGSMLLFIWVYAHRFGWQFGVGFAVIIFIHEMGHVTVNKMNGLEQSAPVFIPFVGAMIFLKKFPDDPTIQSECGAGGPAAGFLAAIVCLVIGLVSGNPFWLALANVGFIMNLFNLIPFPPLDGSHISTVFSPKLWNGILITLLLWVIKFPSAMLWLVLLVSFLFRMGRTDVGRHQLATPQVQFKMGVVFVLLCIFLSSGYSVTAKYSFKNTIASKSSPGTTGSTIKSSNSSPNYASRQAVSATNTSSRRKRHSAIVEAIGAFILLISYLVPPITWLLAGLILSTAAGRGISIRHFYTVMILGTFHVGLMLTLHHMHWLPDVKLQLMGASLIASISAFLYAAYQAFHLSSMDRRPPISSLIRGALMSGSFGAFIIAYAFNSIPVLLVLLAGNVVYFIVHRWVGYKMLGDAMISLGRRERAIEYYHKALLFKPGADDSVSLWIKIAATHLVLDQGSETMKALASRDTLLERSSDWDRDSQIGTISDMYMRAAALMLMDRHNESLAVCERILASPGELLPNGNSRLLLTHIRLAKIARIRGWMDETIAQSNLCLSAISKRSKAGIAALHCLKASAYIDMGKLDLALEACDLASKQTVEPYYASWVSVLKAQIDLKNGMPSLASKNIAKAIRLLPDNLEFRYWYGKTLVADGKKVEGENVLLEMRQKFPEEHWGKLAGAALSG